MQYTIRGNAGSFHFLYRCPPVSLRRMHGAVQIVAARTLKPIAAKAVMSGRRCSSLHRFSEVERLGLFFCLMNLGVTMQRVLTVIV